VTSENPFEGEESGNPAPHFEVPDDISGIDNLLEEGGPLEPQDVLDVEGVEAPLSDPLESAQQEAAERTADLQRLQAEFLNYKRRVDRDRELVRENAVFAVLTPMLEVLDNIDRAREAGDPFDPALHEALSHVGTSAEVIVPTCQLVAKAGYKIGDRVVRAAQVLVVDPADAAE
jgi:molecular chaperone GrpE